MLGTPGRESAARPRRRRVLSQRGRWQCLGRHGLRIRETRNLDGKHYYSAHLKMRTTDHDKCRQEQRDGHAALPIPEAAE